MKGSNRRRYFTEAELGKLIRAARKGRWGQRDATLILLMARHGLRVSEAVDLEWNQIDFTRAHLHVRRRSPFKQEYGMHEIHNDPIRHYPHLIQTLVWHLAVKLMQRKLHARAYLLTHRAELIAAAIKMVRTDPEFLKLGESEAKRRGRMWPIEEKPNRPPKFVYPLELMKKDWPSFEDELLGK